MELSFVLGNVVDCNFLVRQLLCTMLLIKCPCLWLLCLFKERPFVLEPHYYAPAQGGLSDDAV